MNPEVLAALIMASATIVAAVIGFLALRGGRPAPARADDQTLGLADQIVIDARAGRIAVPITAAALQEAYPNRNRNYLATVLADYCEPNGNYVQQGQRARFTRVGKGRYRPIS